MARREYFHTITPGTGTGTQFTTESLRGKAVTFKAHPSNSTAGVVYVRSEGATGTDGWPLTAGQTSPSNNYGKQATYLNTFTAYSDDSTSRVTIWAVVGDERDDF